ncbi:MAG: hypothetical protein ACRDID_10170 [Ktedonobacterales bacterium]
MAFGRLIQPHQAAPDGRFARATLANQAERLAAFDRKRNAIDGAHGANLPLEKDALGDRKVHH